MKNKAIFLISLTLSASLLSSCFLSSLFSKNSIDKTPAAADGEYTYEKNAKDIIGKGLSYKYLQSTGTARILVIPVAFKGDSFSNTKLQRLYNSFFKDSDSTGWESVYSFYNKSSYGKLSITGDVTDPVDLSITVSEYKSLYSQSEKESETYTDEILEYAVSKVAKAGTIDLSKYDMDGDGYLDAVWLVYSASYNANSDSLWAYTTWNINTKQSISGTTLKTSLYSWASIDFLTQKQYSKSTFFSSSDAENGDAHTYIHETGHMLGLDDYYSYDYGYSSQGKYMYDEPVGGIAMMDCNVGDHDMFSKYVSGWVTPTVITEEYLKENGNTLKLTSSQSTNGGNMAFLIPNKTNKNNSHSPFGEYLLVEYYTPTGLNESDTTGYNNAYTYGTKGVIVYHVNASIGKVTANRKQELVWDGKIYDEETIESANNDSKLGNYYAYTYIYSNTKSYSFNVIDDSNSTYYRGRLISLLSHTGKKIAGNAFSRSFAQDSSLFKQGDSFGTGGTYSEFKFDDDSSPEYGFTVDSTSDTECSITFQEF